MEYLLNRKKCRVPQNIAICHRLQQPPLSLFKKNRHLKAISIHLNNQHLINKMQADFKIYPENSLRALMLTLYEKDETPPQKQRRPA